MSIVSIRARALAIPFKQAFAHASASRSSGHSVWVEACDDVSHNGFGEGCPREYVTGETLEDSIAFVAQHQRQWISAITDCSSLASWVDERRELIDRDPAAWSAVERALLDLFARTAGCSVEHVLGLPDLHGVFRYSAVLGDACKERCAVKLSRYVHAGFTDFKIKLNGGSARGIGKIEALRETGIASTAVRAGAHNLWSEADQAIDYLSALVFPFTALEEHLEPVTAPVWRA
ncbi:MAG: L-alanine-DL-glutamate epimerase-like enolase superfamily enzyme [Gammaproteobacteria bacterium]